MTAAPPPLPGAVRASASSARADPAEPVEARKQPRAADQVRSGALAVLHAARLVTTDPALRGAAIGPTLLTAAACLAVAGLWATIHEGDEPPLQAFVAALVALSSMPPTILFRAWARVGLAARRAHGAREGDSELASAPFFRTVWRESAKAARQALVVAVGLVPVYVLVAILPFVGHGVTIALGFAWAWYWIVVDAIEIPVEVAPGARPDAGPPWFERRLRAAGARSRWLFLLRWGGALAGRLSRPWRAEAAFTERHPWETLGFAIAAGGVLAIPVVGLLFRAVAITAATGLLVREEPGAD